MQLEKLLLRDDVSNPFGDVMHSPMCGVSPRATP
jgi:hypothetical protein